MLRTSHLTERYDERKISTFSVVGNGGTISLFEVKDHPDPTQLPAQPTFYPAEFSFKTHIYFFPAVSQKLIFQLKIVLVSQLICFVYLIL